MLHLSLLFSLRTSSLSLLWKLLPVMPNISINRNPHACQLPTPIKVWLIYIHTYIHTYKYKLTTLHDFQSHAKVLGNYCLLAYFFLNSVMAWRQKSGCQQPEATFVDFSAPFSQEVPGVAGLEALSLSLRAAWLVSPHQYDPFHQQGCSRIPGEWLGLLHLRNQRRLAPCFLCNNLQQRVRLELSSQMQAVPQCREWQLYLCHSFLLSLWTWGAAVPLPSVLVGICERALEVVVIIPLLDMIGISLLGS